MAVASGDRVLLNNPNWTFKISSRVLAARRRIRLGRACAGRGSHTDVGDAGWERSLTRVFE
jgi:hypothetical protein